MRPKTINSTLNNTDTAKDNELKVILDLMQLTLNNNTALPLEKMQLLIKKLTDYKAELDEKINNTLKGLEKLTKERKALEQYNDKVWNAYEKTLIQNDTLKQEIKNLQLWQLLELKLCEA